MASPVAIASPGLSGTFLSNFDASYWQNVLVPEYSSSMVAKYGKEGADLFLTIYNLGMKSAVQTPKGWGWEKGLITNYFTTQAQVASPTAGATATVVVATGEVVNGNSYPIVYDEWMHLRSGVVGVVLTKSGDATTLTIRPKIATEAFGTIQAGDAWMQVATNFPEGSDGPEGRQSSWYKYYWQTQILRAAYNLTGSQTTNKPQWNRLDVNGDSVAMPTFWSEGTRDMEAYMMKQFAQQFFLGEMATNTGVANSSTGLNYELEQRGLTYELGGANLQQSDLRAIGNAQALRWSGNVFMGLLNREDFGALQDDIGSNATQAVGFNTTQLLADMFFEGNVTATKALESTFDFQSVVMDGTKYLVKINKMSSDPTGWGIQVPDNNRFANVNYFIPLYKAQGRDGGWSPHVEFKYKAMDGVSRLFSVVETGRSAPIATSTTDLRNIDLLSEAGWFFRGLEQFTITTPHVS